MEKRFWIGVCFILSSANAWAQPRLTSLIQQPRTLAMGGAGVALADDEYALFMNPAGLAGQDNHDFRLLGLSLESSQDTYSVFGTSLDAVKNFGTSSLNQLMGKDIYFRGGLTPIITLPHFSIAYVVDMQGSVNEFNQANPYFKFGYMVTHGIQAGMGWSFKEGRRPVEETRFGVALKMLWRKGGFYDISTAGFLQATAQGKQFIDNLVGNFGVGVGADIGGQYIYHLDKKTNVYAGASVTDVGNTKFSDPHASPIEMNMGLGVGFKKQFDAMSIAADFDLRYLNQNTAFSNKTHLGVDVGIPLLNFMAGLNQLYFTFGVAFDLWIFRVSALTYGEELGVEYQQIPSRRYLLQLDFKLPI